ncbi:MAG TPA: CAP domain-containing protein [Planctomycetota bacterium]|nr:CAP domain-containing protein [Planctomycetota bacterium]
MRAALVCYFLCCATALMGAANCAVSPDEQAIIEQTNVQRRRAGLGELKASAVLCAVARRHAVEMARANKLSHRLNGKSSSDRVSEAGYKWLAVSENIAWNQRSVPEVMDGWMRSEGHRENLLGNDITEMGAGIAANAKGELYFVQVFARPERRETAATLQFVVKNATESTLAMDVNAGKLFTLKPGEQMKYELTTAEATPRGSVGNRGRGVMFSIQDGGQYTVVTAEGRMRVMQGR